MEYLSRKENPICKLWQILWAVAISTGVMAFIVSFFSLNTGFEGMNPPFWYAISVFSLAILMPLYSLPAFFAHRKRLKARRALTLWNFLLGWSVIGYFACVVYVRLHNE